MNGDPVDLSTEEILPDSNFQVHRFHWPKQIKTSISGRDPTHPASGPRVSRKEQDEDFQTFLALHPTFLIPGSCAARHQINATKRNKNAIDA